MDFFVLQVNGTQLFLGRDENNFLTGILDEVRSFFVKIIRCYEVLLLISEVNHFYIEKVVRRIVGGGGGAPELTRSAEPIRVAKCTKECFDVITTPPPTQKD